MRVKKSVFFIIVIIVLIMFAAIVVRQKDVKKLINMGYENIGSGFYVRSDEKLMQAIAPGLLPKTYAMSINGPALEGQNITGIWMGKSWPFGKTEYGVTLPNEKLCLVNDTFSELAEDADVECKGKDIFVSDNQEAYSILSDYYEGNPYNDIKKETT